MNWANRIHESERKTFNRQTVIITSPGDKSGYIRKGALLWTPEQYARHLLWDFWRMVK